MMKEIKSQKIGSIYEEYLVKILQDDDGNVHIERLALRNKVRNKINTYTFVSKDKIESILSLDLITAEKILNRISAKTHKWSDAFVFNESQGKKLHWEKSDEEHKYTSTGIKFWRHVEQMENFKAGKPGTIISTHISPEGSCNLKCGYCSVTYRDTHSRIELDRIKKYVLDLKERGLKAVILTGGGEPTIYKNFNELISFLANENMSIGLITNGTQTERIDKSLLKHFSWVRISINVFEGWQEKIKFPFEHLSDECVVGCSMVYTGEHEIGKDDHKDWLKMFKEVSKVADKCGAKYIRVLPNCLLEQDQLLTQHEVLQKILQNVDDKRFFQQYKIHGAPDVCECNQAYFRPYLSEEPWHEDGVPGTVYPCDSVVLNEGVAHFSKKYQVCKPENISDFLERKTKMNFNPKNDCKGCVFTENVEMLESWKNGNISKFDEYPEKIKHEEFV